ncbi:MAG TPA: nuclear transport factor 2 family protein [Steroidobacteraceae bacterium]|jgi:hypothetical protein
MNISRLLVLTLGSLLCAGAPAAPAASKAETVVANYLAAHNAKDIDGLLALLSDAVDMRILMPDGTPESKRLLNRAQQRETFANAFRINPNAKFRVLAQVVSGSTVVVREEGTGLVGDMRELGLTLYRVNGDKIAAIWILNGEGAQRDKR